MIGVAFSIHLGCTIEIAPVFPPQQVTGPLVVGRVLVVTTGDRGRQYDPEVRSIELENQETHERINIEIASEDQRLAMALPSGLYRLNRVEINEGPFLSVAQFEVSFSVGVNPILDLGIWRFGVDSPRYGRKVLLSIVSTETSRQQTQQYLKEHFPAFGEQSVAMVTPEPAQTEARLYEVMPYPQYSRYFRRHWW